MLTSILNNIKKKEKVGIGDNVIGEVIVVKDNMVVVELLHAFDKVLSPADMGVIFVKNIDTKFVDSPSSCFSKGDLIKARIIEVGPYEYKMATNSRELGVVKSICKNCKEVVGNTRNCKNCGAPVFKKFASE